MRHEAPTAAFCAAALASMAAFASGHGWVAIFTLPAWVLFGLRAIRAVARELDGVRLREAQRWRHLLWFVVERPQKDGDTHVCHYCKGTWKTGENPQHDGACWYEAWWDAHRASSREWNRWCQEED